MASTKLFVPHLLVPGLAAALGLGLLTVTTPARSEPVGVPVSTYLGGTVAGLGTPVNGEIDPPAVLDGKTVTAIAAGASFSVALTSDGKVAAWGAHDEGQTEVPAGLTGKTVTAIAAGTVHALALTSDGEVTAWGLDTEGETHIPATLDGKTATAIAAGDAYSLALTSDGKVTGWGVDGSKQTSVPAALDGKTVTAIAAGLEHSLALTDDGKVTGWGDNLYKQAEAPAILDVKTVTAIAAGGHHSMALTSEGQVVAWGENDSHQSDVPPKLDGKRVVAIAAGFKHSLALTSEGRLVGWGDAAGDRYKVPDSLASKVITAIASGFWHSLVVATDFRAEGKPVISGDPVIAGTLSATPSRYTATPDKISYQWYADGAPIVGATAPIYHLACAQLGKRISVQVTAILDGFPNVVTTSDPTGPVVRAPAPPPIGTVPTVKLDTTSTKMRLGQAATLSWSSSGATTLTASGGWAGALAASGSGQVKPTTLGVTTYTLIATNSAGTAAAQVKVSVTRPAAKLKVTAAKGRHRAGSKVEVTIRGLEAGEKYTIRIGKKKITGTAKNARPLVRAIPLPKAGGRATIRVTGDQPDRTGTVKVRVVRR